MKEPPWVEHLTSPSQREVGALSNNSAFKTTKERQDLMPSKQIIVQTIMEPPAASESRPDSTTTLGTAPCHRQHGVAHCVYCTRYIRLRKAAL